MKSTGVKILSLPRDPNPQFCRVPTDELFQLWEPTLELMFRHPRGLLDIMSPAEIHHGIQEGLFDLWVGIRDQELDMALLTSFSKHAHKSYLYIVWGGGRGKEYWGIGSQKLEHFAQILGASEIRCHGRVGLQRWGRKLGYTSSEVVLIKHLPTLGNERRH